MKFRVTIIFLVVFFISSLTIAQKQLLFENKTLNKTITIEAKDYLNLQFNGYLNQTTELKSYIAEVKDSSLVFTTSPNVGFTNKTYEVKNSDITGFRKLSIFQPYIKPAINISVTIGSYFVFDASNKFSDTEVILYTTVVGIATSYIVNLIFKDNIEFKIADGWNLRVGAFATP
jgi:hypothetical protein